MFLPLFLALTSSNLIGFDLGTESVLAAVLRSGRSIEMVLNEQSKRKTPAMVSFQTIKEIKANNVRSIDRQVGFSCTSVIKRNSSAVIRHFPEILGKIQSPELDAHFISRNLDFKFNKTLVNGIEPEIALAMIFEQQIKAAEQQLQQTGIRDAVIAVPSYFTIIQRQKVARAAKLAKLNLLQIIDEKTAISLLYALEKTPYFTREPKDIVFLDFGAGSLQISAFHFSAKIISQRGRNPKPVPKIEEIGFIWDDTLGGIDFDILLAKYFVSKYNLPQISGELLEDVQHLKHALTLTETVNISFYSINDRIIFNRTQFYEICKPLFDRFTGILNSFNRTFDTVELIGGSTRIPYIQELISKNLGPIGRSLNSDEAVVMGAAYTAAMSSGAFRLMEVHQDSTCAQGINLTYGQKSVKLYSIGSLSSKSKTARFDSLNDTEITLSYDGKIPIGCDRIISKFNLTNSEVIVPGSRIALSFSFNNHGQIHLTKSLLFMKDSENKISQTSLSFVKSYSPLKISKEMKSEQVALLDAFNTNDARLAKIAEAHSSLEALIFELRDALAKDHTWQTVASHDEQVNLNHSISQVQEWLLNITEFSQKKDHDNDHNEIFENFFEDDTELREKARVLEEEAKPIRYRVTESHSREAAILELEYLLNEMQDSVLNRWPARKLRVPKAQKKAILNHVKMTKDWLKRQIEEQKQLDPWDDPILKTSDIQLRIQKLGDAFKNLEEKILTNRLKNKSGDDDNEEEIAYGADL